MLQDEMSLTASPDVLPGGNRAIMETAQGDLGEASGYGRVRSRRNVAGAAEFAESERLRQFEQQAQQREQSIINDKNILNEMCSANDANIHAAAQEVRMLRDHEEREVSYPEFTPENEQIRHIFNLDEAFDAAVRRMDSQFSEAAISEQLTMALAEAERRWHEAAQSVSLELQLADAERRLHGEAVQSISLESQRRWRNYENSQS